MAKVDWMEVKARLKKAMGQAGKVLKEGGEGMSYVAGQTAHVIQLEFEIHQLKTRIGELFRHLGETVYVAKGRAADTQDLRRDLDLLHASLKKKQNEIKNTHLTASGKKKKAKK